MNESSKYFVRVFWSDEDGCFIAEVPELPGCSGLGKTEIEALRESRTSIREWLAVARKQRCPIPKPMSQAKVERLNLRLPSDVVMKIRRGAKEVGMSVNQFVMTKFLRSI